MNPRERIIYGAVVALVVFVIAQFVLTVGSILINIVYAILMGAFAILAVSIAMKIGGNRKG